MSDAQQAMVRTADCLLDLVLDMLRALTQLGGLWIIENPVRRNDARGPWKRFNSGKFPDHCSLWHLKRLQQFAVEVGAHVLHVPLCWFAHEPGPKCSVPQKYVTLMYSPALEPALKFLKSTRCVH